MLVKDADVKDPRGRGKEVKSLDKNRSILRSIAIAHFQLRPNSPQGVQSHGAWLLWDYQLTGITFTDRRTGSFIS